jgi:hypothetical protein
MHARSIQTKAQTESKAVKQIIEVLVSLPPPPLHTCSSKEDTLKAPFAGATAVFFAAAGKQQFFFNRDTQQFQAATRVLCAGAMGVFCACFDFFDSSRVESTFSVRECAPFIIFF